MSQPITLYQQRDFGQKINGTFQYFGQHLRTLVPALLYIAGPFALIAGIASGANQSRLIASTVRLDTRLMLDGTYGFAFFLTVGCSLLASLLVSLVVYAHLRLSNGQPGAPVRVGDIWDAVQSALGRSLLVSLMAVLLFLLTFPLLLLPGIYVAVVLSLALPVTFFEAKGPSDTIARCFGLITGKWWSTFGLIVVMALIAGVMSWTFSLPNALVLHLRSAGSVPGYLLALTAAVSTVGQALLSSVVSLAVAFQYFNLVDRRDGNSLDAAIDSIGTSSSGPARYGEETY